MARHARDRKQAGAGLLLGRERTRTRSVGFHRESETRSSGPVTYDGDAHVLTIAPTGAGKGVGSVIPNALLHPGPLIVFDPKGEVYAVTHRHRRKLGQRVVLLDPFGVTGQASDALNPLDVAALIDPDHPDDVAASTATLLTGGKISEKDPFWDNSAAALLTGLLLWLICDCPPPERRFSRLYEFFSESDLPYRMATMLDTDSVSHSAAIAEFIAFLGCSERETRPSIQATARQHLPIFGSAAVRAVTDQSSFDPRMLFRGDPISLFIIVPPTKLLSHRPIIRLWLGTLILALAARRSIPSKRTLMLIDEAAQLGPMPPLIQTATLLRGAGVTLWTFFQSPAQLEATYGKEAMVLADNAGVIQLFKARNGRMAKAYAQLLGDVSPEAVMNLGDDEQLLLKDGGGSFLAARISYLDDPLCQGLFDANPLYMPAHEMAGR